MLKTAMKLTLVCAALALPAASFARGGGGGGGGARGAGFSARVGEINAALANNPSSMPRMNQVAPLPPPRISVPPIPQFK